MKTKLPAILMTATKTALLNYLFVLMAVLLVPVTTYAACDLRGAYIGYDENGYALWINRIDGPDKLHGSYAFEAPGFDLTLGGIFPNAVKGSDMRGVWKVDQRNTYDVALVSLSVNASGGMEWIERFSGTVTLSKDCDTLTIDVTFDAFLGNQDPFDPSEVPLLSIPLPTHNGYRMRLIPTS